MSSANDYSRLGVIRQDETHDYTALMKEYQDVKNWFLRAQGKWTEVELPFGDVDDGAVCGRCGRADT